MYSQEPRKIQPPDDVDDFLTRYTKRRVREEAQKQGVDPDLAERQFGQESAYKPDVIKGERRSSAGAIGTGQLMPGTAKDLGVDPYHVDQNIEGSVRYMKQQLDTFGGDTRKALAAYNAGPGRVMKAGGVPNIRETQDYVNKIAGAPPQDDIDEFLSRYKEPQIAIGHSQNPAPLSRPPKPKPLTKNVFNKNVEAERAQATNQAFNALEFRPAAVNELRNRETARINQRVQVDPKLQAQAKAYQESNPVSQLAQDVYSGMASGAQTLQQAGQRVIGAGLGAGRKILSGGQYKPVDIRPEQGRLAQEYTQQKLEEQQRASGDPISREIAAAVPVAAGGTLAATAGGLPALAGYNVGLEDWQDPTRSAARAALNTVVPIAGAKIGTRVAAPLINKIASPLGQQAARIGTEVVSGGATNVGQTAAEQQYFDGRVDPNALIRSGIVGGALSGAMAAQPNAPARLRPNLEARQAVDQRAAASAEAMNARANADTAPAPKPATPDAPPTTAVPKAAPVAMPKREDFLPGALGEGQYQQAVARAERLQARAEREAKKAKPMEAGDLRSQVDLLKTEAAEAENAGNYEAARTKYRSAQQLLNEMRGQAKKAGNVEEFTRLTDEANAANRNWQLSGNRAAKAAKQRPAQPPTPPESPVVRNSQPAVENAPTRDLSAPLSPVKEVVPPSEPLPPVRSAPKTPQAAQEVFRTTQEIPRVPRPEIRKSDIKFRAEAESQNFKPQQDEILEIAPKQKNETQSFKFSDFLPTNRITEGAGDELPRRVSRPLEGQPIETPTDPAADRLARLQAAARAATPPAPEAPAPTTTQEPTNPTIERLKRLQAAAQKAAPIQLEDTPKPEAAPVNDRLERLKRIANEVNARYAQPEAAPAQPEPVRTPERQAAPKPQRQPAPTGEPKLSNRVIKQSLQEEMGATSTNRSDKLRLSGPSENYREVITKWDDAPEGTVFRKPEHYGDEANVLFDRRLEDRKTTEGDNALFFMEAQSDWHQSKDAPPAPMRNTWLRRALDDTVQEATEAGQDGVLLPKTVEQLYEIQRWGAVREKDGRYYNSEGFDITPVVRRYLKELPDLARKAANKAGVKLETRTVDDGKGGKQELWYLPTKKSVADKTPPRAVSSPVEPISAAEPSVDFAALAEQQAAAKAEQKSSRRKATGTLSPIEYLKRKTNKQGFRVSDKGEARKLGSKESGIVGLTNRRSKWTTHDAQVMLDEGGFMMPDGRAFTDPSVTESDVLDFLDNYGKQAKQGTAELDKRLADEEEAYYRRQEEAAQAEPQAPSEAESVKLAPVYSPEEAAIRKREALPPVERRRALRDAVPKGQFGKLSEAAYKRGDREASIVEHPQLRRLLDLPEMPPYHLPDAPINPKTGQPYVNPEWQQAAQDTLNALAGIGGKERSSQINFGQGDAGSRGEMGDLFLAVRKLAQQKGEQIDPTLREAFRGTVEGARMANRQWQEFTVDDRVANVRNSMRELIRRDGFTRKEEAEHRSAWNEIAAAYKLSANQAGELFKGAKAEARTAAERSRNQRTEPAPTTGSASRSRGLVGEAEQRATGTDGKPAEPRERAAVSEEVRPVEKTQVIDSHLQKLDQQIADTKARIAALDKPVTFSGEGKIGRGMKSRVRQVDSSIKNAAEKVALEKDLAALERRRTSYAEGRIDKQGRPVESAERLQGLIATGEAALKSGEVKGRKMDAENIAALKETIADWKKKLRKIQKEQPKGNANETQSQAPDVARNPEANRAAGETTAEAKPKFIADAEARLKDYKSGRQLGGGQQLLDQAIVTGYKVYKAGMDFAQWSAEVVKEAGEAVKPHLRHAWAQMQKAGFGEQPRTRADAENSPEFKRWFRGSKVVNKEGQPVPVYHGTTNQVELSDIRSDRANPNDWVQGFFMTESPKVASEQYAQWTNPFDVTGRIIDDPVKSPTPGPTYPLYASIRRPFDMDAWLSDSEMSKLEAAVEKVLSEDAMIDFSGRFRRYGPDIGGPGHPLVATALSYAEGAGKRPGQAVTEILKTAGYDGLTHKGANDLGLASRHQEHVKYGALPPGWDVKGRDIVDQSGYRVMTLSQNRQETAQALYRNIDALYPSLKGWLKQNSEPAKFQDEHQVWVAFDPGQVKSYTGNRGTFSPESGSILMADPFGVGAGIQASKKLRQAFDKLKAAPKDAPKTPAGFDVSKYIGSIANQITPKVRQGGTVRKATIQLDPQGMREMADAANRLVDAQAKGDRAAMFQAKAQMDNVLMTVKRMQRRNDPLAKVRPELTEAQRWAEDKYRDGRITEQHRDNVLNAAEAVRIAAKIGDVEAIRQARRNLRDARRDMANRGVAGRVGFKTLNAASQVARSAQALTFGSDWSYIFRQGGPISLNPLNVVNTVKAFQMAYHAQGSETGKPQGKLGAFSRLFPGAKGAEWVRAQLTNHPMYKDAQRAGLETAIGSGADEIYRDSVVGKLPWVKRTEAANEAALDFLRLHEFGRYKKAIDAREGQSFIERQRAYEQAAEIINTLTGRTDLGDGKVKKAVEMLNGILSAPRLNVSRIKLLDPTRIVREIRANPAVGGRMAKDAMSVTATIAGALALGNYAGFWDVSLDPDDPDFAKARDGDTRYDVSFGMLPLLRLYFKTARYGYDMAKDAAQQTPRSERERKASGDKAGSAAKTFARGRLGPLYAYANDLWWGSNLIGEHVNLRQVPTLEKNSPARRLAIPLTYAEMGEMAAEGYKRQGKIGAVKGAAKATPAMVGIGVQQYDKTKKPSARR